MRACDRGCHSRSLPLPIDRPYDQGGHMQPRASVAPISSLLETLEVGEPLSHGALTVIPLLAPRQAEPDWLTLAEAGAAVTITEVSAGGEVPTLSLVNDADRPVLLLDGTASSTRPCWSPRTRRCASRCRASSKAAGATGASASTGATRRCSPRRAKKAVRVSTSLRGIRAAA